MQRMMRIDECTKREMYDLLVDLGAPIEKMITDGLTVAQLKVEYEDMLLRQMKDWQKEKEYLKSPRKRWARAKKK